VRLGRRGAPTFLREAAIGLGMYAAALGVRKAVWSPGGRARARRNADRLMRLEQRLGIAVEPAIQRAAMGRVPLGALNAAYVGANIAFTVGSLAVLLRRGDPGYRPLRRSVAGTMLAAQVPFLLFPTAPPRATERFVDTLAEASGVDLDRGAASQLFNPIASMPSIHMAWAVISAESLRACSSRPSVRAAAALYPPAVATVVLVTANHLVVDVLAGSVLGWAGLRLARVVPAPE
jgi:PAP2 superfamily protein